MNDIRRKNLFLFDKIKDSTAKMEEPKAHERRMESINKLLDGLDPEAVRCVAKQFARWALEYKEAFLDAGPDQRKELYRVMHEKKDATALEKAQASVVFNAYDIMLCLFAGIEEAGFHSPASTTRRLKGVVDAISMKLGK